MHIYIYIYIYALKKHNIYIWRVAHKYTYGMWSARRVDSINDINKIYVNITCMMYKVNDEQNLI